MLINLITREECGFCDDAKALLQEKELSYLERRIDQDIPRNEVVRLYPDQKLLPIVTVDGDVIGGFFELKEYLSDVGI